MFGADLLGEVSQLQIQPSIFSKGRAGFYSSLMELTCLSRGRGIHFPPCYILDVCGVRILLNCPIDLSASTIFSPLHHGFCAVQNKENLEFSVDESEGHKSFDVKRQKLERPLDADALICTEPWYKTVTNLHLWNVSFIDIVLISSPYAMLGLPFLTRDNGFSAKIYVPEAAAKLGKLMMDDLVAMHSEYTQFYGPEEAGVARWMNWEVLESLPSGLRERILGLDGAELGGWMRLYSAADIVDSAKRVHTLKYAEEICYNGSTILKASSSGSEIGACNWTIKCPNTSLACVSNSLFGTAHALEFDYHALSGNDMILYADFSFLNAFEHAVIDNSSAAEDNPLSHSGSEDLLLRIDEASEEREKLDFICSCVIASVAAGGSALIPIDQLGITLQLLEHLFFRLENSGVKVPIYVISSVAEEILAFTNVIPEWLCKQRQEQLFSGEPLFVHVEAIREGKIEVHPDIYSPKLLATWREPCIVFCPHWNLRLGPVVHLLRRWHKDQNSLLVMEDGVDSDIALLPFSSAMKMKVLRCSFLSGIKLEKIEPLLETLQPKLVLLPENLKLQTRSSDAHPYSSIHYSVNEAVGITCPQGGLEVDIAPELIPRSHGEGNLSMTRLTGNLAMQNGRHQILPGDELPQPQSSSLLHWGSPDLQRLLSCLSEMGVTGSLPDNNGADSSIIRIKEPHEALVEVRKTGSTIITADRTLATIIFKAVSSVLDRV